MALLTKPGTASMLLPRMCAARLLHGGDAAGTAKATAQSAAFSKAQEEIMEAAAAPNRATHRSQSASNGKRWLHYNQSANNNNNSNGNGNGHDAADSVRERNLKVTSYYNQTAIDKAAQQVRQKFVDVLHVCHAR